MMDLFSFEKDFYDRMKQLSNTPCNSYELKLWEDGKLVYDSTKSNKQIKPNNNVPKNIKGDYDLSIHGNKIVLVDNADGTTVEAKCHPDDNFDIGEGIKEAFKKMNEKREELRKQKEEEDKKIKVGDWVEVVRPGSSYGTLSNKFFERNNIMRYATRYRYGVTPEKGTTGKVVLIIDNYDYVITVETDKNYGDKEYDDLNCYNSIYVVGQEGLKKVVR